jgi:hypothetical protein
MESSESKKLPPAKPRPRRGCFTYGCLPLLLIALFFFVGIPTWRAVSGWWEIRSALSHGKSVKLIHYNPYAGRIGNSSEIIYGTKDLSPGDYSKVSGAFLPLPDFGMPSDSYGCLFDPHHKIVITDAAGNETVIRVCFLCDHVQIGEGSKTFCTPFLWRPLLHKFFNDEGLPYTPDRYMQDYQAATKDVKTKSPQ